LIYDYYKKIEARTSELGIIAEKAIEFRESDFDTITRLITEIYPHFRIINTLQMR
jgi:hypothetical protein